MARTFLEGLAGGLEKSIPLIVAARKRRQEEEAKEKAKKERTAIALAELKARYPQLFEEFAASQATLKDSPIVPQEDPSGIPPLPNTEAQAAAAPQQTIPFDEATLSLGDIAGLMGRFGRDQSIAEKMSDEARRDAQYISRLKEQRTYDEMREAEALERQREAEVNRRLDAALRSKRSDAEAGISRAIAAGVKAEEDSIETQMAEQMAQLPSFRGGGGFSDEAGALISQLESGAAQSSRNLSRRIFEKNKADEEKAEIDRRAAEIKSLGREILLGVRRGSIRDIEEAMAVYHDTLGMPSESVQLYFDAAQKTKLSDVGEESLLSVFNSPIGQRASSGVHNYPPKSKQRAELVATPELALFAENLVLSGRPLPPLPELKEMYSRTGTRKKVGSDLNVSKAVLNYLSDGESAFTGLTPTEKALAQIRVTNLKTGEELQGIKNAAEWNEVISSGQAIPSTMFSHHAADALPTRVGRKTSVPLWVLAPVFDKDNKRFWDRPFDAVPAKPSILGRNISREERQSMAAHLERATLEWQAKNPKQVNYKVDPDTGETVKVEGPPVSEEEEKPKNPFDKMD